jgi:hypothetical protein
MTFPKSPPTSAPATAPPAGFARCSCVVWVTQETVPNRSAGGATQVRVVVWGEVQATSGTSTTAAAR